MQIGFNRWSSYIVNDFTSSACLVTYLSTTVLSSVMHMLIPSSSRNGFETVPLIKISLPSMGIMIDSSWIRPCQPFSLFFLKLVCNGIHSWLSFNLQHSPTESSRGPVLLDLVDETCVWLGVQDHGRSGFSRRKTNRRESVVVPWAYGMCFWIYSWTRYWLVGVIVFNTYLLLRCVSRLYWSPAITRPSEQQVYTAWSAWWLPWPESMIYRCSLSRLREWMSLLMWEYM